MTCCAWVPYAPIFREKFEAAIALAGKGHLGVTHTHLAERLQHTLTCYPPFPQSQPSYGILRSQIRVCRGKGPYNPLVFIRSRSHNLNPVRRRST